MNSITHAEIFEAVSVTFDWLKFLGKDHKLSKKVHP